MGFDEEKYTKKYEKDQKHYDKKVYKTQKVKMYRLKHWIFDFGGVMVQGVQALKKVIAKMNEDLGFVVKKSGPEAKKWRRMLSSGRLTAEEFLQKLVKNSQPFDYNSEIDVQPFLDYWFQVYSDLIHLSPEMELIVERLHKADYHVSLMSNTYGIHARSNELKGFFDLFDDVFLSNELKMRKPDIEKYKYVLNKLDAKPKETIFIDDKLINLVPARKLGINVIRFESFEQFQRYLSDLGIEDLTSDSRYKILEKYKIYKTLKEELKQSKKDVKQVKKELKKLAKHDHNRTYRKMYRKSEKQLQLGISIYEKLKHEFKKQKKIRKEYLEPKLKLEKSDEK